MKIINDIVLNFDEIAYPFYEWRREDPIEKYKRVPIIRVPSATLKDLFLYKIKLQKSFFQNRPKNSIITIFTTKKDNIAIEFDDSGKELYRSRLTIQEDLNICELAYSMKEEEIQYLRLEKITEPKELRIATLEKSLIKTELNTLKISNNLDKLSYLYYEWFSENEEDINQMILRCHQELEKEYTPKIHEIAKIIKQTYKEKL
ncbi:MAG: hypothetical protein IJ704_04785 [Bacilli bacterium]|nr:hypothetical protein [Bacilli bacterium]